MKVITWNCNGAFRKKFDSIIKLAADIYIIQECEDPSRTNHSEYKEWASNYLWIGDNKNKGVGVFAKSQIDLKKLDWSNDYQDHSVKYFLPCLINNEFQLLAVWAHRNNSPNFGYIGQFWKYLETNFEKFSKILIAGDFNSNVIWDEWDRWWNHSDILTTLEEKDIKSLYHKFTGEEQGKELNSTFYLQRKVEKAYHIDYFFGSKEFHEPKILTLGEYEDWIEISDHVHLTIEFKTMGKKLTVYMIDGTEYGPRFSEIGNWVGKAVYSPRANVNKIMSREEFNNPGVYCLKGDPTDDTYDEKIYIGEAENIRARLKQHLSDPNKDFKELIFFVSKDELLTKTQIRYLESRLVQIAIEAKTAQIENGNSPSLPTLHEADISDMEYFLDQIRLILPVMGFKFLISSTIKTDFNKIETGNQSIQETYFIKTKTFKASMTETDQGYIVAKGSEAKKTLSASCTETYRNMRRKLIDTKIMIEKENKLVFDEDTIFNSPSAASNMILGRNSNGFTEWVNKDGISFKEVQEQINE